MELFTSTAFVFYTIGIASMVLHAVKKWTQGEVRGNLIDWYWMNPRATVGAALACLGGIGTAILSGALTDFTVGAQILAAVGIGYAADTVNSQKEAKSASYPDA